ncbi:MAG: Stk1 family PASTA domain-containing Ser/Thr kinase [Lachnospiraceae bacterium]|nr:Stk1 family PASTA domain-containing Ser/Thr kinase [Lachnospiraceae bacterium]
MLKSGTVLGERYEIVGRVGSGGMADVYKATDHKLNRYVAVKVMKPEFREDGTFISKFRREAQAAAGLANPNIVNVFDVGEDQGNYYIVMELVEGITLKDYIGKKGKLSVREATSIAIQVCMGLAAAHSSGIVHRDVKPQNIIISTDGKVKVTDFGIARAASSNTISANAMGSVHYSSPEQVRGGYSDSRSDIYSLGITLYEMVTGRVPFDGETTVAIAIKHLQDAMEPPSKYTPELPHALEQIIYKCTQKSVDRRYQTMDDVIADLKHSLVEPDGDFVNLSSMVNHSATVAITDDEREKLRKIKKNGPGGAKGTASAIKTMRPEEPEDEPEEETDDIDDGGEGISSKLEKAMTIGGFVIGAIIICVLIYFIGRAAGLFGTGKQSSQGQGASPTAAVENTSSTASGTAVEATATPAITAAADADGAKVTVPQIVGLTEEAAQAKANEAGLGIKKAGEEGSEQYPAGQITRQEPAANETVDRNSTITFYVSKGSVKTTIPDVSNMSLADAQAALAAAGFTNITVENVASSDVATGNVISVNPAAGQEADPDTQITITVSNGPDDAKQVTVESWGGLDQETATRLAEELGLVVKIEYGTSTRLNEGDVISQSISSGTEVAQGTEIVFTINDPSKASTESESSTQTEETSAQPVNTMSSWSTSSMLGEPSNYMGGAYRLVLQQTVDGDLVESVIAEGSSIEFPYQVTCNGAEGVSDGNIVMYELSDGEYQLRVSWPVVFTAGS